MEEEKKKRNNGKLSMKFMREYVEQREDEDIEWFIETYEKLTKEGLTGIYRNRPLEAAFKERFPELKAKAKAANADKEIDELKELLKSRKKKR